MRYTISNTINKPLTEVVEKFKDPEGLKHWMEGYQRMERISGEGHEVGTKTDFYFKHKKKEMKITLNFSQPMRTKGKNISKKELRLEKV